MKFHVLSNTIQNINQVVETVRLSMRDNMDMDIPTFQLRPCSGGSIVPLPPPTTVSPANFFTLKRHNQLIANGDKSKFLSKTVKEMIFKQLQRRSFLQYLFLKRIRGTVFLLFTFEVMKTRFQMVPRWLPLCFEMVERWPKLLFKLCRITK